MRGTNGPFEIKGFFLRTVPGDSGRSTHCPPPEDVHPLRVILAGPADRRRGGHVSASHAMTYDKADKGTLTRMNPPNEITPEYAESLVSLLSMMGDLDREALAFLVGHMASKNIDLAIEAYGALMTTRVPSADS